MCRLFRKASLYLFTGRRVGDQSDGNYTEGGLQKETKTKTKHHHQDQSLSELQNVS